MSFENFVSRRYLFSGDKQALVSVIIGVAVTGLAIGVASLVLVIGVMDGAIDQLLGKMVEVSPHIKIVSISQGELVAPERVINQLADFEEIEAAEPVLNKQALVSGNVGGKNADLIACQIIGLRPDSESPIFRGLFNENFEIPELQDREVILGNELAKKLDVAEGDSIIAITGLTNRSTNRQQPAIRLKVASIFTTGYYQFDALSAFVSAETAASFMGDGNSADYVQVQVSDPLETRGLGAIYTITRLKEELQLTLGPGYQITTWIDESGNFPQNLRMQKVMLFLILMLIVMVAGFNIIGTLIILVIEKTREIGILKALGASHRSIMGTFVRIGGLIGVLGSGLGVALGLFGVFLLKYVVKFEMPPSVYNFERLPVTVNVLTLVSIVVCALVVCLAASIFPALQASRLNPVESLRHE